MANSSIRHGGFLTSIEQMRNIEWGKTHLWDVKFGPGSGLTAPFDSWFPASDFSENSNTGSSLTVPYYMTQVKFPQSAAPTDITMSVYDDANATLYKWLTDWYNYVYDDSDGTAMLADSVKELHVVDLSPQRQIIKYTEYSVYPEQSVVKALNSQAEAKHYELNFVVAAYKVQSNPS